mgnify:CR=1 FL=1
MEEGKCYEINNLKLHSVDNNSEYDRVHLLIDIMPESETRTIDNVRKDLRVKVINNFVEQEDADILVKYIQDNHLDDKRFLRAQKAVDTNRVRYESHIPEKHEFSSHPDIIHLLKKYSDGKEVLNVFGYTGGFSVYALAGNAKLVHSVDSSKSAIELTDHNVALNFGEIENHKSWLIIYEFFNILYY